MPRIRTIKPEFFQDEKLAPLSPLTRLTFLGLISMADDAGRLLDNVKVIDAFVFPETKDSCKDALKELADLGRIIRGVSESGQRLIEIAKWQEHQRVTHPSPYTLPVLVRVSGESHEKLVPLPTTTITTNEHEHDQPVDLFPEAWAVYPKRPGNSKADALKAWNARIREGCDPAVMLDGVRRYAGFVAAAGTEPRFIKMAATFFGPGKHFEADYSYLPAPDEFTALAAEAADLSGYVCAPAQMFVLGEHSRTHPEGGLSLGGPFPAQDGASL